MKPPYWREYLMFGMFYFTMEAYQTLQWLYGDVYEGDAIAGIENCTATNTNFTIVGNILIWLQPILFAYIGYRTTSSPNVKFAKCLLVVGWIVFFYSLISIHAAFHINQYYQINESIFGLSTCTNKGETGHLVWRYKPVSIDYFPNYLMYLIMCIMAFATYDRSETQIIDAGWIVSLVVTKIYLGPSMLEIASSWCLLSIIANCMIFAYLVLPYFDFRKGFRLGHSVKPRPPAKNNRG